MSCDLVIIERCCLKNDNMMHDMKRNLTSSLRAKASIAL